jgi:ketosteroid isomerase-like protein
MSVDAVRRSYAAFARHDLDGALAMMHEDIVWHQAQGLPHGGIYHGLAEVRSNVFDPIDESWWENFKADPEEVIGVGDDVVVLGRYTATATSRSPTSGGSATGAPCGSISSRTRAAGWRL